MALRSKFAIFVSYRRSDSGGQTGRLYDRLINKYGTESVFLDVDSIPYGQSFRQRIQDSIAASSVVLLIIGPEWLRRETEGNLPRIWSEGDTVRFEIAESLRLGVTLLPILVGNATMPRSGDLPENIQRLAEITAFNLSDIRFHKEVSELINVIDQTHRDRSFISEEPSVSLNSARSFWNTFRAFLQQRRMLLGAGAIAATATLAINNALNTSGPPSRTPASADAASNASVPVAAASSSTTTLVQSAPPLPRLNTEQPDKAASPLPSSVKRYVSLIAQAENVEEKRNLREQARKFVMPTLNFGSADMIDKDGYYRRRLNFVEYKPMENILVIDERIDQLKRCTNNCGVSDARLTIHLNRLDQFSTYIDGFHLSCYESHVNNGRAPCISYTTRIATCSTDRCSDGPGQNVTVFYATNITAFPGLQRFKSAVRSIVYEIGGLSLK